MVSVQQAPPLVPFVRFDLAHLPPDPMPLSTWPTTPFAARVLTTLRPTRVVEISGESLWSTLLYDALGRERADRVRLDTIAAHDPARALAQTRGYWDLCICGQALAPLDQSAADAVLAACLERADYVLVNLPMSDRRPTELLLSTLVASALEADVDGEWIGAFLLSRKDPLAMKAALGRGASDDAFTTTLADQTTQLDALLEKVAEKSFELDFIKSKSWHKAGLRLQSSAPFNALRWAKNRNTRVVDVEALGERADLSAGNEVWLIGAANRVGQRPIPWDYFELVDGWRRRPEPSRPYGECLHSERGRLRVALDDDPELCFIAHAWSGKVRVTFKGRSETIDLYSPDARIIKVRPAREPMVLRDSAPTLAPAPAEPQSPGSRQPFSKAEQDFIERVQREKPQAIASTCPRWLGVTSSTRNIFPHLYHVPSTRDEDPYNVPEHTLQHHADVLLETGCNHIVLSGGDEFQHRLMLILKARKPSLRVDLFFHASYPQFLEDYTWHIFKLWLESARAGRVHTIASDKWGYDRFVRSLGVRGAVLLNRIEGDLQPPPHIPGTERRIGMWLSGTTYRKIPHAMLSALAMVPNIRLRGSGLDKRALELIDYFKVPVENVQERQLPHAILQQEMRRTHLTMYVTFIECCPMLPLESLHLGVPALTGPNSHLFEDCPELHRRLVVPYPDRAEVIADYVEAALTDRDEILRLYAQYHPIYEARCKKSIEDYLAM